MWSCYHIHDTARGPSPFQYAFKNYLHIFVLTAVEIWAVHLAYAQIGLCDKLWMTLCIWDTAHNVHPPKCPSTCMVTSGRNMWTINLLFFLVRQRCEVVCMLQVYQTRQDYHRLIRNRNRHIHIRFVGRTGPRRKCLSSSDRNELNGAGGIIVINRLLLNSCMAQWHGNWCWPVVWMWWILGQGYGVKENVHYSVNVGLLFYDSV